MKLDFYIYSCTYMTGVEAQIKSLESKGLMVYNNIKTTIIKKDCFKNEEYLLVVASNDHSRYFTYRTRF